MRQSAWLFGVPAAQEKFFMMAQQSKRANMVEEDKFDAQNQVR